jgi:hypothetical protein
MPATSAKQKKFMDAVAHNKAFAKKVKVPQSVGREFSESSKGLKFKEGGDMKESKKMVKKEIEFMKKKGAPKSMVKHEMAEMDEYSYGGKVKKMAMGGQADPRMAAMMAAKRKRRPGMPPAMPPGMAPAAPAMAPAMGPAPTMKSGGRIASKGEHSVQKKSKRGAEMVKMASGGYVKAADGVAQRGKTKGTQIKMSAGGKTKRYC